MASSCFNGNVEIYIYIFYVLVAVKNSEKLRFTIIIIFDEIVFGRSDSSSVQCRLAPHSGIVKTIALMSGWSSVPRDRPADGNIVL